MENNIASRSNDGSSIILNAHRKGHLFKMKINWKIDLFSFQQQSTASITSPTICIPNRNDENDGIADGKWYLVMIPMVKSKRETEHRERDFISLHLRRDSEKNCEVPTRFFLRLLNEKDEVIYHRDCAKPVVFSGKGSGSVMWGWDRYVAHDELFDGPDGRRGYLVADPCDPTSSRDSLSIQAEIHCLIGTKTDSSFWEPAPEMSTLDMDLRSVFERKNMCDFVLVSSDNQEIPAHRVILDGRCEVFQAMFSHESKEKTNGRIYIDDLDGETLLGMLEYLYCDSVTDIAHLAEKLLIASDKYRIKGLKRLCESHFSQTLCFNTAGYLAYLADTYNALHLHALVKTYVANHYRVCLDNCHRDHASYLTDLLDGNNNGNLANLEHSRATSGTATKNAQKNVGLRCNTNGVRD